MTSNLKKLARERQAKTGESYAAARAALVAKRQPPQSFTAIVMKVISLATTAFTASAARGPHDLMELALGGRLPEEQALEDYLEALPAVTLRKLEALMYLGRDHRTDVLATGQVNVSALDLPGRFSDASSDPERNVERMTSKFPLPDYLRDGLTCCIYIGFNAISQRNLSMDGRSAAASQACGSLGVSLLPASSPFSVPGVGSRVDLPTKQRPVFGVLSSGRRCPA
jgi:hypothetical protein